MLYEFTIAILSITIPFALYFTFLKYFQNNLLTHDNEIIFDKRHDLDGKELLLVSVLMRHGPRTPADTYPKDPHINETFAPFGWGHITNKGKQDLYETGQWLRSRYGNFLGSTYQPDAVWAQSTGVTRAQMSLQVILAALFPPQGTAMEWNRRLNWQPIPIFSEPLEQDTLLLVRTPCPRYYEAVEEVLASDDVKKVLDENANLFEELTKYTGMAIKTPDDVQSLYSTLRAEHEYGLSLPKWTQDYYPDKLENITDLSYIYNIYTNELKQLKAGPFIQKLINEFQHKQDGTLKPKDLKISLYTGHDSSVVNVLSGFNVWEKQFPVYGIMAIFELVRDKKSGEVGVQMYLRKSATSGAIPLIIPGCQHFCPLSTFIELGEKVIPKDRAAACVPRNKDFVTPPPSGP
ncbi:prostatic acid phosphatase-like isoform X2 [Contarinia nasturtii]|uniref:prostatic acid phosphatase-like isoform X2 n=1 Tax=Contarinia nasturtii TaxID=265458 RepID=UPI0012D3C600|nr:prostatic acid phosphatase-like isoform X2 [Contarinia nasturtii]